MIKEVIFFTPGDPNDVSLWSNVPYLYGRELERRGIAVHKVNFLPFPIIKKVFNRVAHVFYRVFNTDYKRGFEQSNIARILATRIIKRTIRQYPNADCCIFMGCGYANYWSGMPTIIFAESYIEKLIRVTYKREPSFLEKPVVKQHNDAFRHAAFISILFPRDLDYIKQVVPTANIKYKGSNLINSCYNQEVNESIIATKQKSKKLLFIGGAHYLEGANMLLRAFEILRRQDPEYELHIIGLEANQLDKPGEGVHCHGYLNKSNPEHYKLYYELMLSAKVFVNPTPFWGSYSSCIEAMFYYTPCVVHPYDQFVMEFGEQLNFGEYNTDFTPQGVADSLLKVLNAANYAQMAGNAHERVKDYSYESYVNWTLEEMMSTDKYKKWKP